MGGGRPARASASELTPQTAQRTNTQTHKTERMYQQQEAANKTTDRTKNDVLVIAMPRRAAASALRPACCCRVLARFGTWAQLILGTVIGKMPLFLQYSMTLKKASGSCRTTNTETKEAAKEARMSKRRSIYPTLEAFIFRLRSLFLANKLVRSPIVIGDAA